MSEPPVRVLNLIGGVSALLPLFASLEQPMHAGTGDSSCLLIRSLRVLRAIFPRSEEHYKDFFSINGFQMSPFDCPSDSLDDRLLQSDIHRQLIAVPDSDPIGYSIVTRYLKGKLRIADKE
jgi:hypothetical protein